MGKKVYKLRDIEKFLTYLPPLFILMMAILSMVISYFIMEHRQKSQIKLLVQEQKFISQSYLRKYINAVNLQTQKQLNETQEELKKNVYLLRGIYTGIYEHENYISVADKLNLYIDEIEKNQNINFVIFDKNFNILRGLPLIENIQELIFSQKNNQILRNITLLYIQSQGESSSFLWKNDLTETIQLSSFEISPDGEIYIGAFSSVNSLKNLTSLAILNSIRDDLYKPKDFYFWLFDSAEKKVFNLDNQKKWQIINKIENHGFTFDIAKHYLTVGISQNKQAVHQNLSNEIKKIQNDYYNKNVLNFTLIFFVAIILMTFSALFSSFIKRIFTSFNKKFENKSRQISRLKERYELAIIASNDGLWDTNFKTNKIFFSKKWLDMFGYKGGEITSFDDWFKLLHVEDQPRIKNIIETYIADKKHEHLICEYRLKMKNTEYKWILARGKFFFDENNMVERLLMMSMDIDDKKLAAKKLHSLVKEEVSKNQEKQKLLIQQNKLAAMGEMIGAIAHQWRQPLNNISLIIHFIRDNVKNKTFIDTMLNDYVNRAKNQITYMSETIDDFQDFYKPSKHKELFDIKDAIAATLSIMQTQIDKHEIEVTLTGVRLHVDSYENEFKQAILNILVNAKDAIVEKKNHNPSFKGKIILSLEKTNSSGKITIFNNGGRASDDVIERMFDPYFTTKFEDKGTGIGLYMTKTIIENNMNGKIYASNVDDGMAFVIEGMK